MAEVQQEIAEMDAASDLQGLDAASEVASSSGRMELVRCTQCSRVMLSEAVLGHLPQCKKVRRRLCRPRPCASVFLPLLLPARFCLPPGCLLSLCLFCFLSVQCWPVFWLPA